MKGRDHVSQENTSAPTYKHTDKTYKQTGKVVAGPGSSRGARQACRHTYKHTGPVVAGGGRQAGRQTDRQTGRQKNIQKPFVPRTNFYIHHWALPIFAPVSVTYMLSFVVWKPCFSWSCRLQIFCAFSLSRVIVAICRRRFFSRLLDTLCFNCVCFNCVFSSRYSSFWASQIVNASSKRLVFSSSSR